MRRAWPPCALQVRAAHRDLRDLAARMSGQMGRFGTLLAYAQRGKEDLQDKVGWGAGCLALTPGK